jgi:hypothetical protein
MIGCLLFKVMSAVFQLYSGCLLFRVMSAVFQLYSGCLLFKVMSAVFQLYSGCLLFKVMSAVFQLTRTGLQTKTHVGKRWHVDGSVCGNLYCPRKERI